MPRTTARATRAATHHSAAIDAASLNVLNALGNAEKAVAEGFQGKFDVRYNNDEMAERNKE